MDARQYVVSMHWDSTASDLIEALGGAKPAEFDLCPPTNGEEGFDPEQGEDPILITGMIKGIKIVPKGDPKLKLQDIVVLRVNFQDLPDFLKNGEHTLGFDQGGAEIPESMIA